MTAARMSFVFRAALLLAGIFSAQALDLEMNRSHRPNNATYRMSNNMQTRGRAGVSRTATHDVIRSRRRRSVAYTDEEKEEALYWHNYYRQIQGASDMLYMYWDEMLAQRAQDHADDCVYVHQDPTGGAPYEYPDMGENLYMSTGVYSVKTAIMTWVDSEVWYYNYDTGDCQEGQQCYHYTQIVWADTYAVGCGYADCQPLNDEDGQLASWARYTVCNYGPLGNVVGMAPFQLGDACTECSTGMFTCHENLCRDCDADGVDYCECYASCENCATINEDCTCECPAEWEGIHCTTLVSGQTDPGLGCAVATPEPPEPPCGGVYCYNGGTASVLNETTCWCSCDYGWQGDNCEHNQDEEANGAVITVMGSTSKYSDVWFYVQPVLVQHINTLCQSEQYFADCCPGQTFAGPYTADCVETADVGTGSGYPVVTASNQFQTLFFSTAQADNALCGAGQTSEYYIPQNVMMAAVEAGESDIGTQLLGCCVYFLTEVVESAVVWNPNLPTTTEGPSTTSSSSGGGDGDNAGLPQSRPLFALIITAAAAAALLHTHAPSWLE